MSWALIPITPRVFYAIPGYAQTDFERYKKNDHTPTGDGLTYTRLYSSHRSSTICTHR